jgi:linalool 8-monooxygenase
MQSHTGPGDLSSLDLTDLALFADGPPHELFARLRSECPVHWNNTADGPGFW